MINACMIVTLFAFFRKARQALKRKGLYRLSIFRLHWTCAQTIFSLFLCFYCMFSALRYGLFPVPSELPLAMWQASLLHLCGYTGIGSSLHTKADNWGKERRYFFVQIPYGLGRNFYVIKARDYWNIFNVVLGQASPLTALFICCCCQL